MRESKTKKKTTIEPKYKAEEISRFIFGPLPESDPNKPKGQAAWEHWQNIDPFAVEVE